MSMQREGGQREDVLLLPLEALAATHFSYLRPAAALRALVDDAARMAMRLRCFAFAQQLELRAHGRHDRPAGEGILVDVQVTVGLERAIGLVPRIFELRRVGVRPVLA